jgi:hypothetical protein
MTYDTKDGYVVMFSGATNCGCPPHPSNDTWAFREGQWTNLSTLRAPPRILEGGAMRFDPAMGDVLLFAQGNNVWTYHGGHWTQIDDRFG